LAGSHGMAVLVGVGVGGSGVGKGMGVSLGGTLAITCSPSGNVWASSTVGVGSGVEELDRQLKKPHNPQPNNITAINAIMARLLVGRLSSWL